MSMMDGFLDYMENTTPGQRLVEGREFAERQRMVADAILLERAAAVIRRRLPVQRLTEPHLHYTETWLRHQAWAWRREAAGRG